jgi:glycosyltransferase involved in cell wall biosynthesis
VPVIIHTEHGRMLHEFDNQKVNRAERFLSRWVNEIVAVSEPTRQKYSGITGIPPGKIQVVPNGIDIKRFQVAAKATLREQLGIRAEDHVAGNVARLSPEKNQALFLRASVRVLRECKNLKVLLVGDGPERNSLEKLVDDLGIRHKVIFAGQRQDIADLLALMDIFVLSSSTEGMPMTLLEAMAAGKAIVCTAAGGIPGVIQDGENGLLCPCGDEEALSNCISGLIRQRDLAAKLRARARKDAENKYSVRHMAGQYEQMYKKHMKGHSN